MEMFSANARVFCDAAIWIVACLRDEAALRELVEIIERGWHRRLDDILQEFEERAQGRRANDARPWKSRLPDVIAAAEAMTLVAILWFHPSAKAKVRLEAIQQATHALLKVSYREMQTKEHPYLITAVDRTFCVLKALAQMAVRDKADRDRETNRAALLTRWLADGAPCTLADTFERARLSVYLTKPRHQNG